MASAQLIIKLTRQENGANFYGETPETQAVSQELLVLTREHWGDRLNVVLVSDTVLHNIFTIFDDNPDEYQIWAETTKSDRLIELEDLFLNYCQDNSIVIEYNYIPWEGIALFQGETSFTIF